MKHLIPFLAISLLSFGSISCDDDEEGELTPIGPEQTEMTISSEATSFAIKTQRAGWFLEQITEEAGGESRTIENTTRWIDGVATPLDTMAGSWYEVIRSTPKEVTFHLSENTSGEARKLIVTITGIGLTYDDLTITQE